MTFAHPVPRYGHHRAADRLHAIHGAVAAGVVASYAEGARRFGARDARTFVHDADAARALRPLYDQYRALSADPHLLASLRALALPEDSP